jgi:tetratricopeptide (TPR) repeat protein
MNQGRLAEAVVPLAAATTLNRQGIAPTLLAEVLLKLNDPTKAKEILELALERQPTYKRALTLRSLVDKALVERERAFDVSE